MPLLTVTDLTTHFHTRAGVMKAVDGVSFFVDQGEILAIVGESGSGKSVACYSLLNLIPQPPGKIESGTALFEGRDLLSMQPDTLRRIRGSEIGIIFQDPMTSLNPYLTVGEQLIEPLLYHRNLNRQQAPYPLRFLRVVEYCMRSYRVRESLCKSQEARESLRESKRVRGSLR